MLIRPSPGALVWPAAMLVWGPGFVSASHSHHCVQLIMAMQGSLRIRGGTAEEWKTCGAVLIRPDATHEIDARGLSVLIGFFDAESQLGGALSRKLAADISPVSARKLARWRADLGPSPNRTRVERWVRKDFVPGYRPGRIHPGVNRVLKHVRERLGKGEDFSLKTLAALSGLSPSRLMHVFTDSVGVPLRPYILWLRLQRGSCELMNGATATEAAHAAGFSDAAHLTRTFRRMLGTTPTQLALRNKMTQGVSLDPN